MGRHPERQGLPIRYATRGRAVLRLRATAFPFRRFASASSTSFFGTRASPFNRSRKRSAAARPSSSLSAAIEPVYLRLRPRGSHHLSRCPRLLRRQPLVGHATTRDGAENVSEPSAIIVFAVVESERLFVQVAEQVERF